MLRAYAHHYPYPVKNLNTENAGVVVCICKNNPNNRDTVWRSAGKQEKKNLKAGRQTGNDVQYPVSDTKKSQETVEVPSKITDEKMPDEPYKDVLAFAETGEASLFKNKYYRVSVSFGKASSRMSPII